MFCVCVLQLDPLPLTVLQQKPCPKATASLERVIEIQSKCEAKGNMVKNYLIVSL